MANDVTVKFGADTKELDLALQRLTNSKDVEQAYKRIAAAGTVAFVGISAAIGGAVKSFATFEKNQLAVKTLLDASSFASGNLEKGFADLTKQTRALARRSPSDIGKLQKALFDTVSAGVDAAKAVNVLDTANKLAVAGVTDISVATDGLTSALNAYQLSADEAENVASKFFSAQKFGKTTVEELASSFGNAAPLAAEFGVSINELLAGTSALTLTGQKTSVAMNGIRQAIAGIVKPSSEAAQEAKRLGIALGPEAIKEAGGFAAFLDNLKNTAGFTSESLTKLFASVEAQTAILPLIGSQAEKFTEIVKELGDESKAAKTFTDAFNTSMEGIENQFEATKNSLLVLTQQLGEKFAPLVGKALKSLNEFLQSVSEKDIDRFVTLSAEMLKLGLRLSAFITVASGSKVAMTALSRLSGTLAPLITGLGSSFGIAAKGANILKFAVKGLFSSTGLGLAIAFLPEIIELFGFLSDKLRVLRGDFSKSNESTLSLNNVQEKQNELIKERNELEKGNSYDGSKDIYKIELLNEQIKKNEELIQKLQKRDNLENISAAPKVNEFLGLPEVPKAPLAQLPPVSQDLIFTKKEEGKSPFEVAEEQYQKEKELSEKKAVLAEKENQRKINAEAEAAKQIAEIDKSVTDAKLSLINARIQGESDSILKIKELELQAAEAKKQRSLLTSQDEIMIKEAEIAEISALISENKALELARKQGELESQLSREKSAEKIKILQDEIANKKLLIEQETSGLDEKRQNEIAKEVEAVRLKALLKREAEAEEREIDAEIEAELKESKDELNAAELEEEMERLREQKERERAQKKELAEIHRKHKGQLANQDKAYAMARAAADKTLLEQSIGIYEALSEAGIASGKTSFEVMKKLKQGEAIINAFAAINQTLSSLPFPANAVSAALIGAQAFASVASIQKQKMAKGGINEIPGGKPMALGGVFTGGIPNVDSINTIVQRDELVTPAKNFEEVVSSVQVSRAADRMDLLGSIKELIGTIREEFRGGSSSVTVGFTDNAFEIIEEKLVERIDVGQSALRSAF